VRIGIDCRLWNESGVGRYIRNLVEQLLIIDKINQYVLFVLPKDEGSIKYQALSSKYTNWKIVKADIRWHSLEEQLWFPSILEKENLDLVHFPYVSVPIFYNKPFVVTIHDLIPYHFPTGEASTLPPYLYKAKLIGYKFVISQAARKAKKIITVSNATKGEIVDHLKVDPSKVVVTYEGVDQKIRNSKSEIRNNFQNTKYKIQNTKYFLYVGNAYPHKNLDNLIEAFDLLCHPKLVSGSQSNRDSDRRGNDIKLILVGREDYFYRRLKEKVHKMNLEKDIKFLGEIGDEELANLYKNALALVMPSFMEGFGLSALEAMANECLVLASDISSLKEICGDAAVYFDPYDVKDMLKKMVNIYHSNDTYHYFDHVRRGFERARVFSWKKMAKETLKIYESCLSI